MWVAGDTSIENDSRTQVLGNYGTFRMKIVIPLNLVCKLTLLFQRAIAAAGNSWRSQTRTKRVTPPKSSSVSWVLRWGFSSAISPPFNPFIWTKLTLFSVYFLRPLCDCVQAIYLTLFRSTTWRSCSSQSSTPPSPPASASSTRRTKSRGAKTHVFSNSSAVFQAFSFANHVFLHREFFFNDQRKIEIVFTIFYNLEVKCPD